MVNRFNNYTHSRAASNERNGVISPNTAEVAQSSNAAVTRPPSPSTNLDDMISAATVHMPSPPASAKELTYEKFAEIIVKQSIF